LAVMLSNLQNSKTNMKTNPDKIVNRDFPEKNRDMIFLTYHPPLQILLECLLPLLQV